MCTVRLDKTSRRRRRDRYRISNENYMFTVINLNWETFFKFYRKGAESLHRPRTVRLDRVGRIDRQYSFFYRLFPFYRPLRSELEIVGRFPHSFQRRDRHANNPESSRKFGFLYFLPAFVRSKRVHIGSRLVCVSNRFRLILHRFYIQIMIK